MIEVIRCEKCRNDFDADSDDIATYQCAACRIPEKEEVLDNAIRILRVRENLNAIMCEMTLDQKLVFLTDVFCLTEDLRDELIK